MGVNASTLARDMIRAARKSLGGDWKTVRKYAEPELRRLARVLLDVTKLVTAEEITKQEAKSLIRIHRNTTEVVLLTAKGMGILAVERAVNAALSAVKDGVNGAAGITLL